MRDHHGPRHVVGRLVGPCYVLTDGRHLLGSLGLGHRGDARGADGRGHTVQVGHPLPRVFQESRLGLVLFLLTVHHVEGPLVRPENHALLGVHVVRGSVHHLCRLILF